MARPRPPSAGLLHRCQRAKMPSPADVPTATTPWKRACDGHSSLKMCDWFQSAMNGASTVARFAPDSTSRPLFRLSLPAGFSILRSPDARCTACWIGNLQHEYKEAMTTLENRLNTAFLVIDVQNGVVAAAMEADLRDSLWPDSHSDGQDAA